jgi:hypothetical protein
MARGLVFRTIGAALLAAVLVGAAAYVAQARERRYPLPEVVDETLYVSSPGTAHRLSFGFTALAADLYWIRAIQYYGGLKLQAGAAAAHGATGGRGAAPDYKLLYPMLDLTTSLDPEFSIAYRFGAIFLAEPVPRGAGRPDLAIALLEKGLRARPDKWEYMQDIGFVHYWWTHEYKAAAEWFARAAAAPGGPWFLRSMAATTLAVGRDRQSSRLLWESIRAAADNDWLRNDAERRLLQLRAMDEIDALQQRVDRFTQATGAPPANWAALRAIKAPPDPTGTPYELENGRVRVSSRSALFPLPDEPVREALPPS